MTTNSNDCGCDNDEPVFTLNPAIGTTPCPEPGATTGTSQPPCPPQACCNFFRTEEANGALNFIYSAGGPFRFGDGLLVPGGGFVDPGVLAGIVCVPNLTPGTYRVDARFEYLTGSGNAVSVVVFPDCDDTTTAYLVEECISADAGGTCDGFLYVEISGCKSGFELIGCTGDTIKNFQISFTRVSGRSIVDCGGSDLNVADLTALSSCAQ